jgi:hypothetical protein
MATQKSALGGGRFSTSNSTVVGNDASTCNDPCAPREGYSTTIENGSSTCSDPCVPGEGYSTTIGNGSWDIAHTSNPSSKDERSGRKPSALVQHTQHIGGSSDDQASHDTTSATNWC